jgi:hypothetical protein
VGKNDYLNEIYYGEEGEGNKIANALGCIQVLLGYYSN